MRGAIHAGMGSDQPPGSEVLALRPLALLFVCLLPSCGVVQAVLQLLTADINANVSVGGFPGGFLGAPLELDCRDSASDELTAMRALHSLQIDHGPHLFGVIGELGEYVTLPLDLLARALGIVLVSPAATSASLGTQDHPYFVSPPGHTEQAQLPSQPGEDGRRQTSFDYTRHSLLVCHSVARYLYFAVAASHHHLGRNIGQLLAVGTCAVHCVTPSSQREQLLDIYRNKPKRAFN